LNDAFFSAVSKDCKPSEVMIRARREGDLEKVFNDEVLLSTHGFRPVVVTRYTKSDYLFRAAVPRDHLKAALAAEVDRIVYSNFKASTRDPKLHACYNRMWNAHADMQELPPYSHGIPRGGKKPAAKLTGADGFWFDDEPMFSPDAKKAAAAIDARAKGKKSKK
jgi:hypothetical protein